MNASVDRLWFLGEPIAVQRRVMKAIGEEAGIPLEFKHVEEILRFASEEGKSGKGIVVASGWKVVRRPEELQFVTPDLRGPAPASEDYDYALSVPGKTAVPEAGFAIEVQCVPAAERESYNPDQLLDADSLPRLLRVRNWRAGDRFWPAHSKSPKKVKELLQQIHVEQPQRRSWPLVAGVDEIFWMRGFPVSSEVPGQAKRASDPDYREAVGRELVKFARRAGGHRTSMNPSRVEPIRAVISTEQIQKRVKELARQISDDYQGQTVQMLAVLENAFMFMADLVRAVDVPVVCQFIKPKYTKPQPGAADVMEIFFSHEPEIRGRHILLVEGLVHSGVTSEFLMSDLRPGERPR